MLTETEEDYASDESRKKRLRKRELKNFERSSRIDRTPTKTHNREDKKIDQLIQIIKEMKSEQKEILREVQEIKADQKTISEEIKNIKEENKELRRQNEIMKTENNEMKKELNELKKNLNWIEKESKKNNIILSGYTIQEKEQPAIKNEIIKFIQDHLNIDIEIKSVTKIGHKVAVVELMNTNDKVKILQNKAKLRNIKEERIYINEDLTTKEKEKQKHIREYARKERLEGKIVKTGYNKVTVNGTVWYWNKDTESLEKLENNFSKNGVPL